MKNSIKKINRQEGYSLMEMLVVIVIVGIMLPAIFTIMFIILKQQAKIYQISETKKQGDYAYQFIKEKISREAKSVHTNAGATVCSSSGNSFSSTNGSDFVLFDELGNRIKFTRKATNNSLFLNQGGVQTSLNDGKVKVTDFTIECYRRSDYANTIVSFEFTIEFNKKTEDKAIGDTSLHYQSRVKINE